MRKSFALTFMAGFVALLSAVSQPVFAASDGCSGNSCQANVDLNFQVVIPEVIHMQIGDPAPGNVNTLLFNVNAADVGTQVPQTGTGGNSGSTVLFRLTANGGGTTGIQVATTVTGGGSGIDCQSGNCIPTTDFIAWDQIAVSGPGCATAPPANIDNAGGPWVSYTVTGGTINEMCDWTFTYKNDGFPVSGTYFGTVTYTATRSP